MKPIDFLLKIWGLQAKDNCYFFLCTKSVKTDKWKEHSFKYPINKKELKEFFSQYSDTINHIYFCPLPFNKPKRRRENVIGSRFLWADLDESNPKQIDLVPQIAWETSPGRFSCLWRLTRFHKAEDIEEPNRSMTYSFGADKAGWDLTQVLRIPGLRNCKYEDKPRSKLLWMKDNKYSISRVPELTTQSGENLDSDLVYERCRRKINPKLRKLIFKKNVPVGKRSEVIWKINNELYESGLNKDEIFAILKASSWNKFKGRRDEDEQLRREINKIEYTGDKKKEHKNGHKVNKILKDDDSPIIRMSDVEVEEIKWIWYPYIAKGKVTIIEGDPDTGKSFLTLGISSNLSNRKKLPEQKDRVGIHKILLLCAEDGVSDTIKPRLNSVGADSRRIFYLKKRLTFDEDGIEDLGELIDELKPTIVIIDPLSSYTYAADSNSSSEVREFMHRLVDLAEDKKVAIIPIRHFGKSRKTKSLHQGLGSVEYAAAARSVIQVGKDPSDDNGRVLIHVKNNIGPKGHAIGFRLCFDDKNIFSWTGKSDLTIDDIMEAKSEGTGESQDDDLRHFIDDLFDENSLDVSVVKMRCESKGYSYNIVKAKLKSMGAKCARRKWTLQTQ